MEGTTAVETPIASGERPDPTVPIVVDEKPPQPENENVTESFFGESVSEAELMGEDAPPQEGSEKPAEEPAKPTAGEMQAKKDDAPPASEEPKTPPPGFVPLAALHEERGKRQAMSQRLQELESTVESLRSGKPAGEARPVGQPPPVPTTSELPEGFKVLTREEFRELSETDVVEAQIYQHNLYIYEKEQAAAKEQADRANAVKTQVAQIIESRYSEMEKTVPGIFEEDSAINKALTSFAADNGLAPEYLEVLTEPATRIVLPDGRVQILGKGAVQFLDLLHRAYQAANPDPSKANALKAEGAAEAIKKLQNNSAGFRGIGDTPPGGSSIPLDLNRNLSEAEFSKLSSDEQERYLSGA